MNKLANYVNYYRNLGRQAALQQTEKTAGMMPRSRLGKAALGALGIGGGIAAAKALSQPEPSTMENLYEGGKDMLSNMSQEELMGYATMLGQLQGGGGGGTTKRSVSETKKKYVAANQSWSCKDCNQQLEATFEVNHIVPLEDGGSNHINNLEALCRNCHGKKTMIRNL